MPKAVHRQPGIGGLQSLPELESFELLSDLITYRLEALLLNLIDAVQHGLREANRAGAPQHHQTLPLAFSAGNVEGQHQPVLLLFPAGGFVPFATGSDLEMPVLLDHLGDFMGPQTVDGNDSDQQHQAGSVGISQRIQQVAQIVWQQGRRQLVLSGSVVSAD